jgi:hypothetical protein
MLVSSAQNPRNLKKQKIKYIVKTATVAVLIRIALIATTMYARRLINAEIVIRLY